MHFLWNCIFTNSSEVYTSHLIYSYLYINVFNFLFKILQIIRIKNSVWLKEMYSITSVILIITCLRDEACLSMDFFPFVYTLPFIFLFSSWYCCWSLLGFIGSFLTLSLRPDNTIVLLNGHLSVRYTSSKLLGH